MEFSCIFSFVSIIFVVMGFSSFIGREFKNVFLYVSSLGHFVRI